ncbi:MAG: hypothetical protein EBU90_29690, partial [Proteobacteria bacterium]|nr:hypothetical protein [Pseudomonadota bacterium]
TIEYIGRNDFQVKIRGYRIELGEIEGLIRAYDGIEQTVVVCIDLPEPNLVAYYVAKDLNEENLKNYLASYLPSYMLPTAYVQLEYLPLTVNGKLDRKALPIPTFELDSYVAPHNEIEFEISKIWQEVLKLNQVGMRDDFFKLGGHSILAIQLTHRMSAFLNKSISLKDIFEYKTIERLLENTQKGDKLGEIPKAQEPYVLSYAQERLWFIESYENGTSAYHIPMIYKIRADIDIARLKIALIKLVERHEILRTIFVRDETGKISQKVLNKVFQIHDSIDMNRPFNLYEEFPIRVAINTNKIQILIHHIAFDGWSREIFLKELKLFYNDQILPKLNTQYKDFASWQRSLSLNTSLDYWRNVLLEYKLLEMPTDYPRPKIYDYRGGRVNFKLDFHKLQFLSQSYGVTLYTVLLLVTGIMLSRYSNQNDFIIGTPVANRAHPQLSELIGLFVNTLVIRFELEADKNFEENAKKLHAKILEAQLHQD